MLVLIVVSVCTFAGCAEVEFIRTVDSYYTIMDKFVITLDKNKLGANYNTVKEAIHEDMITFRNYVYSWIDSFEVEYQEEYLMLKENIICQDIVTDDNELSMVVEFSKPRCFALFYGLVSLADEECLQAMEDVGPFLSNVLLKEFKTEELGIFLYKYSMVSNKSFMSGIEDFKIDDIGVNYYEKYTNLTGCTKEDIKVSQVFAYPDDGLYSNADEVEKVDGFTFMAWDLTNKDDDFEMQIYKLAPYTIVWYVLAMMITVTSVIVGYIVIRIVTMDKPQVKITKKDVEKDEQ